ncbi:MAG: DUF2332 domain-containing protein [Gammaproteobacteria bacterium]
MNQSASSAPPAMNDASGTSDKFLLQAGVHDINGAFAYGAICRAIAVDPDLIALAAHCRPGQVIPHFFMGVLHYVALRYPQHAFAEFFPSIAPKPRPPAQIAPVLKAFCSAHRDEIIAVASTRTCQTTAVDRAPTILLSLDFVARRAGAPLSLIEVGCSAGLLLMFDRFGYDFGPGGTIGDPDSPVRVRPVFRGTPPTVPARLPPIAWRVGVDLHAVEVGDSEVRRWIQAQTFPEWVDEAARTRAALEMRAGHALDIRIGDALDLVPSLVRERPDPVCVLHSNCLYQWSLAQRERFDALLRDVSRGRVLHRVGIETSDAALYNAPAYMREHGEFPPVEILYTEYRDGAGSAPRVLGLTEGYGRWMQWNVHPAG